MLSRARKAFTLIELLIVVAIIAILAAIAVPNFLEAQTRSKVSRTAADMRTTATALEAYHVDWNAYPQANSFGTAGKRFDGDPEVLERLSTPVAYVSNALLVDPYLIQTRQTAANSLAIVTANPLPVTPDTDAAARQNSYIYQAVNQFQRATTTTGAFEPNLVKAQGWFLHSVGPDGNYYNLGGILANEREPDGTINLIYDPTNGTLSAGSLWRHGGVTRGALAGTPGAPANGYAAGEGLARAIELSK